VLLPDGRAIGFAEFGATGGLPLLWMHGLPGGRRQVPPGARRLALERGIRLIGIERPGSGDSTAHLHEDVAGFAGDVAAVLDELGIDRFGAIGLSGGGPYVLACAHRLRKRMVAGAVLGGVPPVCGPDAAPSGGLLERFVPYRWLLERLCEPLGVGATLVIRALAPLASSCFDLYVALSPEGDRRTFRRPGMKEMFLDDLVRAARKDLRAALYDLVLFTRPWGFSLREVRVPIRFWHGDVDPFVPLPQAWHMAGLVPDSRLVVRPGESHLGGLDAAEEVIETLLELWRERRPAASAGYGATRVAP